MNGLSYELRSWAVLVEGTGGLNRTEVMRKAADRIDELEAALWACLPYMKYPRDASDGLVRAHNAAFLRARAVLGDICESCADPDGCLARGCIRQRINAREDK